MADLTIGGPVTFTGSGNTETLGVRIGNAGARATDGPVNVVVYQGDPDTTGTLVRSLEVPALPAASWDELSINVSLSINGEDIHALIDPEGLIDDCRVGSNRLVFPRDAVQSRAWINSLSLDSAAGEPLRTFRLQLSNNGRVDQSLRPEVAVLDVDDNLVATLDTTEQILLGVYGSETLYATWDTSGALAGDYRVHARLYDDSGERVHGRILSTTVEPDADPAAAFTLTLERTSYATDDRLALTLTAANLTSNQHFQAAGVEIWLYDAFDFFNDLYIGYIDISDLVPGARRTLYPDIAFTGALPGEYYLDAWLYDANGTLAAEYTTIDIVDEPQPQLVGAVTVSAPSIQAGDAQTCTQTLTNQGTGDLEQEQLLHRMITVTTGEILVETAETVSLAAGAAHSFELQPETDGLAPGGYACLLQTQSETGTTTLAFDGFTVTRPPVEIEAELALGTGARLLALIDQRCPMPKSGRHGRKHGHKDDDDHKHERDDDDGHEDDDDRDHHGRDHHCRDRHHGHHRYGNHHRHHANHRCGEPENDPAAECAATERAFLDTLLTGAGLSYQLADDPEAFTDALHSGGYGLYLLQSGAIELPKRTQEILIEAVYNGASLIVAGDQSARDSHLQPALGIDKIRRKPHVSGIEPTASAPFAFDPITFTGEQHPLTARSDGAEAIALYSDSGGLPTDAPALLAHAYGDGLALYAGFDLLAQATADGPDSSAAQLLQGLLDHAEPETQPVVPGSVQPLVLSVRNRGIALSADAWLDYPEGVTLIDYGLAEPEPPLSLSWPLDLAVDEEQFLVTWLTLPEREDALVFDLQIQPDGFSGVAVETSLLLEPEYPPGLEAARLAMEGMRAYRKPRRHLDKAARYLDRERIDQALERLIKAAQSLSRIDTPEANELRHWVGNAIAETARLLPESAQ